MSIRWSNIRVPAELHSRLVQAAAAAQVAHEEGRVALPPQHVEACPLYHVIEQALNAVDSHRERARRQSRAKARLAATDALSQATYTSLAATPGGRHE